MQHVLGSTEEETFLLQAGYEVSSVSLKSLALTERERLMEQSSSLMLKQMGLLASFVVIHAKFSH